MKNLFFTLFFISFTSLLFAQNILVGDVREEDGGHGVVNHGCCYRFSVSFTLTAPLPSNLLSNVFVGYESATGTLIDSLSNPWIEEISDGPGCTMYTYTKELVICFERLECARGESTREEIVELRLTTYDNGCLAESLNSDPNFEVDYFMEECLGPDADSCEPIEHTFTVCCDPTFESQENPDSDDHGYGSRSHPGKSNDPIISPNPCFDYLNIENLQGGEEIRIFSITGEKVKSLIIAEGKAVKRIDDLKDISSGLNLIQVVRDGQIVFHFKFVKH